MLQYLFGWEVAVLYAVMPTNVSGVAWNTGNYSMSTVFLVLTAYFFFTFGTWWGVLLSAVFYYGALESTVGSIPFAFLCTFLNPVLSIPMYLPLVIFMTSARFRHGIKIRKEYHEKLGFPTCEINLSNIVVMTKVLGYYIALATGFMPLGFFHSFGKEEDLRHPTRLFYLSGLLLTITAWWGYTVSPLGIVWFFLFIGIFSQYVTGLGQFVTERYTYLSSIGVCIILANALPYELFIILASLWFMITLRYIPA